MRGPFVTFEGPEGGGKSEQARRLAALMQSRGWRVDLTREPGGTKLGEALRSLLLSGDDIAIGEEAELLMMSAARAQHVRERILPSINDGQAVICDRFVDSTFAYQGGGRGLDLERICQIQALATGGLVPDLRILLDLPVEDGLARRMREDATINRIDRASLLFHQRVRDTFLRLAEADPDGWAVIDARDDVATVAQKVHTEVEHRVLTRFMAP